MLRGATSVWLALLLVACSGSSEDDPCGLVPESTLPPDLVTSLDEALVAGYPDAAAPGVAAHVVVPGVGVWYGAHGFEDYDLQTPMTPAAVFRIGSITKTFTAAAVLQLVAEGAWQLDDPIDDYVPGWSFGPEVTIERLLEHTSGIYNYTDDLGFLSMTTEEVTPAEVIDFALEHGQVFEPGTGYSYSNTGYYLLGLALESVEGKPYHQVVRDRLIAPNALPSIYLEQYEPGACATSAGHVSFRRDATDGFSMSWAWAAGGLAGNVTDLCAWGRELLRGNVLDPDTLALMKTEGEHSSPPERYSLGLRWQTRGGRELAGHTGSTMGFNGELFVDPATGVCVAVQTNDFFGVHETVAEPLWGVLAASGH